MIDFSIIVPVYNTSGYLEKCIESIISQKGKTGKYEAIIINDGSTDNSEEIILRYQKQYPNLIKYYKHKNSGLSYTRNFGVKKSSGKYLLFVDSDDYLDLYILSKLIEYINKCNEPDVIRINSRDVMPNGEIIQEVILDKTSDEISLLKETMKKKALEVSWGYIYKADFFKKNNFTFPNQIHEDYGLTPIILYKANTIKQLNYIGYNYVKRDGSIIEEKQYDKLKKRFDGVFILYREHMDIIKKDSKKGKLLRSYSLESMLTKLTVLNKSDLKTKLKEITPYIKASDIYCYNYKKLIKKICLAININLYLNLYKKYNI